MRREWSAWIKERRWSEFEKLAKTDPSQPLTDTVAELERGFPDKPDRRALRKVLFLLAQAGFEPTEIEEYVAEPVAAKAPISVAFMVSADRVGDSVITYGREDRGRIGWLIAHFTNRDGITRAIEDTMTPDEYHVRLMRMQNLDPSPEISAEIPVEFALFRLAQAVSVTKNMPPVIAYWRKAIPKEFSSRHPAEELERGAPALQNLTELILSIQPAKLWRLELGAMAPAVEDFGNNYSKVATKEEFGDLEWWSQILAPHREVLFTPEIIADHRTRLLDLAYLMHLNRSSQVADVLYIADDLLERGAHSAYAQWTASKTLILLLEILSRENAKERSDLANGGQP